MLCIYVSVHTHTPTEVNNCTFVGSELYVSYILNHEKVNKFVCLKAKYKQKLKLLDTHQYVYIWNVFVLQNFVGGEEARYIKTLNNKI